MLEAAKEYLDADGQATPFFVFVGDQEYRNAKSELLGFGLHECKTSTFCHEEDRLPDLGKLLGELGRQDAAGGRRLLVTGLGEYLLLRGQDLLQRTLGDLKDRALGGNRVVLLLRGLGAALQELQRDPRFDRRRYCDLQPLRSELAPTLAAPQLKLPAISGCKALLEELENGRSGRLVVCTELDFQDALCTVSRIASAFDAIKQTLPGLDAPESCGAEEQWTQLLAELNQHGDLDAVFAANGLAGDVEAGLHEWLTDTDFQNFRNWLFFLRLRSKREELKNGYLRFALERVTGFAQLGESLINALLDVAPTDPRFPDFFQERKRLLRGLPDSALMDFLTLNNKKPKDSIFRLTDNTRAEREAILAWLAQHAQDGNCPELATIYPALALYLKHWSFHASVADKELAELLTRYFSDYKRQKVGNRIEPGFHKQVEELALTRPFNQLPTRDMILSGIKQEETLLYWLDALGVEYMALIEALARGKGLACKVHIVRAVLPTITSENRNFYEEWQGEKRSDKALDDLKHGEKSPLNPAHSQLPVHLAEELAVIATVMEEAARTLKTHKCSQFLLASDHGASRLAVIAGKEERYETEIYEGEHKGRHSGRCCPAFSPYDLPFAAEENGWLALADYGRFKGGRAADVEVHGGASLEEAVVPLVELSLKNTALTVELVESTVKADFREGTVIELYFNQPTKDVYVVLSGKGGRYQAEPGADAYHYQVRLTDVKKAGKYTCEVYAGNGAVGDLSFQAKGRTGTINTDFDDFF